MKKLFKQSQSGFYVLIFSLLCISCSTEEFDSETVEVFEEEQVSEELVKRGVPSFNLFHPTRGINASVRNDKFFSRSGSTHRFYLPKGTVNKKVSRRHARMEVSQTSGRWGPGRNHSFEARFNVSTTLPGQITILQQYAVSQGPQTRIEIRSNGDLKAAFGDGKPVTLAKRGRYNRSNFRVKIVTNGRATSVFLNGKRIVNNRKIRFRTNNNQFRWGLYYNTKTPKGIRSTVSGIDVR